MRVANAWDPAKDTPAKPFPFPFPPYFLLTFPLSLARVVWWVCARGLASNSKHFLAMRSHFSQRLRVWFLISHVFTTVEGAISRPSALTAPSQASSSGDATPSGTQVEGRMRPLNIQDAEMGQRLVSLAVFMKLWQPFRKMLSGQKNEANWTCHLVALLLPLFLPIFLTRITLCSGSSSWQTNLNLY